LHWTTPIDEKEFHPVRKNLAFEFQFFIDAAMNSGIYFFIKKKFKSIFGRDEDQRPDI
jgi:hypothetical protein